jgi:hypothetical protein
LRAALLLVQCASELHKEWSSISEEHRWVPALQHEGCSMGSEHMLINSECLSVDAHVILQIIHTNQCWPKSHLPNLELLGLCFPSPNLLSSSRLQPWEKFLNTSLAGQLSREYSHSSHLWRGSSASLLPQLQEKLTNTVCIILKKWTVHLKCVSRWWCKWRKPHTERSIREVRYGLMKLFP